MAFLQTAMTPQSKPYGVAPRPRVALVGLSPKHERPLVECFPTTHRIKTVMELPDVASPAELDLIVSAADTAEDSRVELRSMLRGYSGCHLILFGRNAWLEQEAPGPTEGDHLRYVCEETSRSTEFRFSAELDPRLSRAVESSLPERALGAGIIRLRANSMNHSAKDPRTDGWLAWALDPPLPFAISVFRTGLKRGLAWFPNAPSNQVALVKALCATWATLDRESFPGIVDWADTPAWMTREEQALLHEESALVAEFENTQTRFNAARNAIQVRSQGAKERADAGPRAILTTNDEPLVHAVHSVFEDLGFEVKNVDEGREENAPKREDLQLRQPGDAQWVGIVEVKGHKKRGAASEDLAKVERHARAFLKQEGREPSLKMYVCNSQFGLPPDERESPYSSHPEQIKHFCDDPDVPGVIVPTADLFLLHRDREVLGLEEARRRLLTTRGVFRYRPSPS